MTNPRPFTIRVFVAEGVPDGLRFVEKSNWIGQGIVCPRGRWPHVKKRAEFTSSGVYILVGRDDENDRPIVYVGEAETVRARLDAHHANKDFWSDAIVFTTKGDPLNKAEVQYLEARLVELAMKHKRCTVDNGNAPNRPGLSEADEAEVAGYLDELLSLLPLLGVNAFEPPAAMRSGPRSYRYSGQSWDAAGYETSSGFAVNAGSIARQHTVPSLAAGPIACRRQLLELGVLHQADNGYRFAQDHEFSSPTMAAEVVSGRPTNGRDAWKDSKGVSLKEHQQSEASE